MASVGTAYIDISGDFSKFNSQIAGAMGGGRFGKLGKAAGVAFAGAVTAAGVGKALFDIGEKFDDAYDTIRVGTGATGKALEGLKKDFRNVVKSVPADFGDASTAVADINTRLGLTGKPLRHLSKQFLELSRITGTDVGTNIRAVTKAFNDWEVPVHKQGKTLDGFFRVSQATGISVEELARQVQESGSPLRQLGFSLSEAAAMFAGFEKAGVNTSKMTSGFQRAITNLTSPTGSLAESMQRLGIAAGDPKRGLEEVMRVMTDESIPAAERTGLAMDVFGRRAGADVAEAIKQGRFAVGDLMDVMDNGSETILKAGEDTQDFAEKWTMLKNRVLVALEPVAMRVFDGMGKAMDALPGIVDKVRAAFDWLKRAFSGAGGESTKLGGILESLKGAFVGVKDTIIAIVELAKGAWSVFGDTITRVAQNALETISGVVAGITEALGGLIDVVAGIFTGDWSRAWDGIKAIFSGVWDAMTAIVKGAWTHLVTLVKAGMNALLSAIRSFGSALGSVGKWVIDKIANGIKTITSAMGSVAGWVKNRVVDAVKAGASAFADAGKWVINRIADGIKTITSALGNVGGWIKNRVVEFVRGAAQGYVDVGTWIVNRIVDGFKTVTNALGSVGGWLRNRIGDSLKAVGEGFFSIGKTIVNTIVNGLKSGGKAVQSFVNSIISILNKIPGVSIGKISIFRQGGVIGHDEPEQFARGGTLHHDTFARGGHITKPLVVVGEEAPKHPEYVIPTNPAYRSRALGLHAQLSKELGVPGFAVGGILGGMPNPTKVLPDWLVGTGKWAVKKALAWGKKQISSMFGDFLPGGESFSGTVRQLERLAKMAKRMSAIHARGFPYVYGGGHSPGTFNGPYDCSGLVSAILRAGDFMSGSMTTDGLKVFGDSGSGKWITIGVRGSTGRNAHTMMKLGNRYLESGSGTGARWKSGWSGSFPIKRHPPGFAQGGVIDQALERLMDPADPAFVGWGLKRGGVVGPYVGAYAKGGVVPRDGLAHVHKGETITPAGQEVPHIDVYIGGEKIDERVEVVVRRNERRSRQRFVAGVAA